jgi:hypothetical protein
VNDVEAWYRTVSRLLTERADNPSQWTLRCETGIRRASAFSWSRYAEDIAGIYCRMAGSAVC